MAVDLQQLTQHGMTDECPIALVDVFVTQGLGDLGDPKGLLSIDTPVAPL